MSTVDKAFSIAVEAHRGQVDKAGRPYLMHPIRVMLNMNTDEERIVALLHDVMEDSSIDTEFLLNAGFDDSIVQAVRCLTRRRQDDYTSYIYGIANNALARRVKIRDLEDNMDLHRIPDPTKKDIRRTMKYVNSWHVLMLKELNERMEQTRDEI